MNQPAMSFLIALAAALAAPAVARAEQPALPEPVGKMTPPAGWNVDPGRSRGLELSLVREDHFGGVPVDVSAQYLMAPTPGGMLLVNELVTHTVPADAGAAAMAELHGVRTRLDGLGETVKVARWDVGGEPADRVAEAGLEWSDASLGTTTISRTLVFQTTEHLVRLQAECILGTDAAATLRGPCETALATLAPLAPVTERVPFPVALVPPAALPIPDEVPARAPGAPTMRERSSDLPIVITVDRPKKKDSKDRRPLYVGIGLLIIAAVYLWNRRNKEKLAAAAESAAEPAAGDADGASKADTEKPAEKPEEEI